MYRENFQKKGLIFDWDGTLFNSIETIIRSVEGALSQLNLPAVDRLKIRRGIGLGEEAICDYLFGRDTDVTPALFWSTYRKIYNELDTFLYEGVEASLRNLSEQGFQLAIATNKRSFVFEKEIEGLALRELFTSYTCADLSKSKPEPDMLLAMCQEMQLVPEQVWMVGDTVHDAHAAQNAGCGMLGLLWGVGDGVELDPVCDQVFPGMIELADYAIRHQAQEVAH